MTAGVGRSTSMLDDARDAISSLWVSAMYSWASMPRELVTNPEKLRPAESATRERLSRAQK